MNAYTTYYADSRYDWRFTARSAAIPLNRTSSR